MTQAGSALNRQEAVAAVSDQHGIDMVAENATGNASEHGQGAEIA